MSASTAAERLDDSYPHGTPAGYRDGCRGNGGCPNRGTGRMTCLEASRRYATDLPYRRAYDTGDIWLDVATPRDPEVERVRREKAHRLVPGLRSAGQPNQFTDVGASSAVGIDAQLSTLRRTEHTEKRTPPATATPARTVDHQPAAKITDARITQLEALLAKAERERASAVEIARQAGTARAAALAERDEAVTEAARIRQAYDAGVEQNRLLTPQRRVAVEFETSARGLHVTLNALLDPDVVRALADRIQVRS